MLTTTAAQETNERVRLARIANRRAWWPPLMYWVRRIHLYSGIFMFPWVMLYGITALLFNHPTAFSDRPGRTLSHDAFAGTALERMANPAADANDVVAAVNARLATQGESVSLIRLVQPNDAVYARDVIVARARGAGQDHQVLLDLPSGTAFVTTTKQRDVDQSPFDVRGLKVPGSLGDRVKAGLPDALTREGMAADDAGISIGTELVFLVQSDGRVWRAIYNVQTGAVTARPAGNPSDLSVRRFLTQLHLAHGYPSQPSVRWLWGLAVDAMFASMVFWGISGLFMWWQIKSVRRLGVFVMTTSLIVATALAIGMHRLLTPL